MPQNVLVISGFRLEPPDALSALVLLAQVSLAVLWEVEVVRLAKHVKRPAMCVSLTSRLESLLAVIQHTPEIRQHILNYVSHHDAISRIRIVLLLLSGFLWMFLRSNRQRVFQKLLEIL